MNPDTNKAEPVYTPDEFRKMVDKASAFRKMVDKASADVSAELLRADGSPVPKHWTVLKVGELVAVKEYTFEVKYIGESVLLLEPVGPVIIGEKP